MKLNGFHSDRYFDEYYQALRTRLQKAAELLNYDWVEWDIENDCYTGHKTEENAEFVARNDLELNQLIQILKGQSNVTQ